MDTTIDDAFAPKIRCDHPSMQQYCDRCMPVSRKIKALRNVFVEALLAHPADNRYDDTVDQRRVHYRTVFEVYMEKFVVFAQDAAIEKLRVLLEEHDAEKPSP